MQSDEQVQRDVLEELRLEPTVDASQIGVAAREGVVTLTGTVMALSQKYNAEQVAKRVYGVRGVANDIEVKLLGDNRRSERSTFTMTGGLPSRRHARDASEIPTRARCRSSCPWAWSAAGA